MLTTVLFVKYIFYDKTEPFSTSLPPTPAISRTNSSKNLLREGTSKTLLPPAPALGKVELDPAAQEQMRLLQSERLKLLIEEGVRPTARCPFSYLAPRTFEVDSNEVPMLESALEPEVAATTPEEGGASVSCDLPRQVARETQTDEVVTANSPLHQLFTVDVDSSSSSEATPPPTPVAGLTPRSLEECKAIFKSEVCLLVYWTH